MRSWIQDEGTAGRRRSDCTAGKALQPSPEIPLGAPASLPAPLFGKRVFPSGAASFPEGAAGFPFGAVCFPAGAADVPKRAAGFPEGAASFPFGAVCFPAGAADVPKGAAGFPERSPELPPGLKVPPARITGRPPASHGLPETAEACPPDLKEAAEGPEDGSTRLQLLPLLSRGLPPGSQAASLLLADLLPGPAVDEDPSKSARWPLRTIWLARSGPCCLHGSFLPCKQPPGTVPACRSPSESAVCMRPCGVLTLRCVTYNVLRWIPGRSTRPPWGSPIVADQAFSLLQPAV